MRKLLTVLVGVASLTSPVSAMDLRDQSTMRPGAFVGARFKLTLGGRAEGNKPVAQFAIAPTRSLISNQGPVTTSIGEGLAFNLSPSAKPTLTLAGIRADEALGLKSGAITGGAKLGMSDGGKVAIGIGAALLLAGGVAYVALANRCTECDQ